MKKFIFLLLMLAGGQLFSQCAIVVSNNADSGPGSLRQAILTANACVGVPTITFSISSASVITLLSDLPNLTHANTTINGTTAPGYAYPNSMVTVQWAGRDDCLQINAGNNDIIRGLQFTNNFTGNGDAAVRVMAGAGTRIEFCRAFRQNKNLVRVQGGTNVAVVNCTVEDFWYNAGNSNKAFEVNSGSLTLLANCNITNVSRKVFEMNSTAAGAKISIHNNTFTNVGYGDSSVCAPTPCGMSKGEHVISCYTNHISVFSIRGNTLNGSFSKFIELINTNGNPANRDSIYNNNVNNCRGQHTVYIESTSGTGYGGIIEQNNTFVGDGMNTYNVDQVLEIGGWANNYSDARITGNVIRNYHGRGIMFRFTDNTLINNNSIYNCSKDQAIEMNNDCDNITIQGNYLGTDAASTPGLNQFTGHTIQFNHCDNCVIGGDRTLGQGNVIIAANSNRKAIEVSSTCTGTTTIRGNDINVNATGTTCLSTSSESAIQIQGTTAVIGGDSALFRNRIAGGTGGRGIELNTTGGTIQGNLIGCRLNGAAITGSDLATAVRLNADNTTLGSTSNLALINKFGYNQRAIDNNDRDNCQWSSNEYWNNTIAPVVDNQGGSPNANIAPPVITSVTLPTTVTGTGLAGARLEVYFWNPAVPCQGYDYLGYATVSGLGTWSFTTPVTINNSIAALQMNALNASEFSCFSVPLPFHLSTFSAQYENENVLLNWQTQLEQNTNRFTIEKSPDGIHFEALAHVPAAGNSSSPIPYDFIDTKPYSGISWYRLALADLNGSVQTTSPVMVKASDVGSQELIVSRDQYGYHAMMFVEADGEYKLSVFDSRGVLVNCLTRFLNPGDHSFALPEDLSTGLYILECTGPQSRATCRWVNE